MLTEALKERIRTLAQTEELQKIASSEEFYFAKAREAFDAYINYKKDDPGFWDKMATLTYAEIQEAAEEDPDIRKFYTLILRLVAYCDVHAKDKNQYNEYPDKRVIANAGIRQHHWFGQLIKYRTGKGGIRPSIHSTFQFINRPGESINILSADHRNLIAVHLFHKPYNGATFTEDVNEFFAPLDIAVRNEDNRTCLYTRLLYALRDIWHKEISGLVARDNGNWKDQFYREIQDRDYGVLWWKPRPVGGNETEEALRKKIQRDGYFYLYYATYGQVTHRARVTDFCMARHYDEKREAWKKKTPIWYSEQAEDYQDGSRTAAAMFLTDEFIKIGEPFRIENFRMYKGVSLPNRNNLSPYVSISNYLEEEENPMNETLETLRQVLERKKQIILQGAPGTGKTYTAKDLAEGLICGQVSRNKTTQASRLRQSNRCCLVQFHPSYAYEDFVRGMVVEASDAGTPQYKTIDKILGAFAREAARNWQLHLLSGANHLQEVVEQKNRWDRFIEFVQGQIDEQGRFPLTPHVYLSEYDDTRFTYKGDNWNAHPNGLNMKYAELERIAEAGVTEKAQVKNVPGIAPLTRTHATYFTRMMQLYQEFRPQSAQDAPVEKVELENYVLIIDEINRANLPVVLGELIYALEYRGERVESMYAVDGDNSLVLPPNLYIIGTMNTADRSVGQIDYAIRRRFAFIDMLPELLEVSGFDTELFTRVSELFIKNVEEYRRNRNCRLQPADCLSEEFRPEDVWIGHSYFLMRDKAGRDLTDMRLRYEIVPILREYLKDGIFKDTKEVEDKIHELLQHSLATL